MKMSADLLQFAAFKEEDFAGQIFFWTALFVFPHRSLKLKLPPAQRAALLEELSWTPGFIVDHFLFRFLIRADSDILRK